MITLRQQASNKVLAKPISCAVRFSAIQASTVADQLMQLRHAHLNPTRRNIHIHRTASCSILSAGPVSSTTSSSSRRHLRLLHNDCSQRVIDQHQGRASYSTRSTTGSEPIVHDIFENKTGSWQYIIADPSTKAAAIVDPVLDYDPASRTISTKTADSLLSVVKGNGYKVDMILETHAHADHLTAAAYLKHRLAEVQGDLDTPIIGIGKRIDQIQKAWGERYNIPAAEYEGVFDKLFDDDETFHIGNMSARAIHLPGHTPDLMGYKIGDCVFVGDSVFNADLGSARADFPGGSAEDLFRSGRKLLSLSDDVKVYTGHDYPPEGRGVPLPFMRVRDHRERNKHLKDGTSEEDFVKMRRERDVTLAEPRLLHQALQINIRAGRLPAPTNTGLRMLHIPLKMKEVQW